ncbi:hypothetical protein OBBRIDRAFT_794435 [Obba rivulosa]|uniref:Uncharacterized protein n=1 Tax=Obba rivulosa TaxID=1052685 RepID=A0A8E2DKV9_9APHY|nr:hypothetical protein OBBRIDRAFT_794435 [Obba rivulosa]
MEDDMRRSHGEGWLLAWCMQVANQPQFMAEQMRGDLPELPDYAYEYIDGKMPEELWQHYQQRIVAIYHQFMDLLSQGEGLSAIQQATMDQALVMQGRSINCSLINKTYGM